MNILPVLIGSVIVVYMSPAASGSGVAQVKCFLNGVKIPQFLRVQVRVFQTFSQFGLASGDEIDFHEGVF